MKWLTNLDMNQNQILNPVTHKLATAPSSPVEGQDYYNTVAHRKYTWNNTEWIPNDGIGATMTGDSIITAINGSTSKIDDDNLSTNVGSAITNSHTHSNKSTLDNITAAFTTAMDTKLGNIEASADVTDAANVGSSIFGTTAKSPLVDADTIAITNSEATNALCKITWANFKTSMKSYTDGLYNNFTYTHPNHSGDVTSVNDGATTIGDGKVTLAKMANMATASFIGRNTASVGVPEIISMTTAKTMLGLGSAAYVADTTFATAAQGATADGAIPKSTVTTLNDFIVATGNAAVARKTPTEVRTILNVEDGANNYVHPTTNGNKHIPVDGAANNFLTYASAGTAGWAAMSDTLHGSLGGAALHAAATQSVNGFMSSADKTKLDAYTQTEANLASAVSLKHSQNTDTGTSSATFTVGSSGAKVKNVGGTEIQIRNNADNAYADLRVKDMYVEGTLTTVNSNDVNIGDSEITLNADITTNATNSDGGLAVKRLKADNTTRADAKVVFNNSTGRWQTIGGDVAATLITSDIPIKVVAAVGDTSATSFVITHNLNTQDAVVTIRETGTPYAQVYTDVEFTSVNTITVKFAVAPTASQYTVTIIG